MPMFMRTIWMGKLAMLLMVNTQKQQYYTNRKDTCHLKFTILGYVNATRKCFGNTGILQFHLEKIKRGQLI